MINGEYKVDKSFGDEVESFINQVEGKQFRCLGCGKIHKIKVFRSVAGENSGLKDKDGKYHWVFVRCNRTKYDNAYWKVQRRILDAAVAGGASS